MSWRFVEGKVRVMLEAPVKEGSVRAMPDPEGVAAIMAGRNPPKETAVGACPHCGAVIGHGVQETPKDQEPRWICPKCKGLLAAPAWGT